MTFLIDLMCVDDSPEIPDTIVGRIYSYDYSVKLLILSKCPSNYRGCMS